MSAAKVFTSRRAAVAHAERLGWVLHPTLQPGGFPPIVGVATNKQGRRMRLAFEWKNSTRHTPAEGAGDNYWWVRS